MEDIVRTKNMRITRLKKDMSVLEQKVRIHINATGLGHDSENNLPNSFGRGRNSIAFSKVNFRQFSNTSLWLDHLPLQTTKTSVVPVQCMMGQTTNFV